MKKITLILLLLFVYTIGLSQQISNGYATVIDNYSIPLNSGAYSVNTTSLIPDTSSNWNHLFVIRHTNANNNYQLQIASSFSENDRIFFRKLAVENLSSVNPVWVEIATRGTNTFTGDQVINGNVGIGVTNPNNKLDVKGTIHSKEVKVDMIGWSDFVFKKEYNLPTLADVEKYINEKGHLENIPSEEEVLKNGINLGEMNAKLLQKIEELTLYSIQQSKEIEILKEENKTFKILSDRLSEIEKKLK
ncbi:hypothetical protein [Flavobacterium sp.]|uniref:hypothetical protein n=1 Tax=Flavobacterium sp. TaxID=239 RepID=UPI003D105489